MEIFSYENDTVRACFDKKQTRWLQPGYFIIFRQIQPEVSIDNNNPDKATAMQKRVGQVF